MPEPLPKLLTGLVQADDGGNYVKLYAADNYGMDPEWLDVSDATRLRDWLTAWLERQ